MEILKQCAATLRASLSDLLGEMGCIPEKRRRSLTGRHASAWYAAAGGRSTVVSFGTMKPLYRVLLFDVIYDVPLPNIFDQYDGIRLRFLF